MKNSALALAKALFFSIQKEECPMRVQPVYFSATGTTKKIVESLAASLADILGADLLVPFDFTLKSTRENGAAWTKGDTVIVGLPVYAGRVPNVLLPYLNAWEGGGARAVCIVLYGNRDYDDALIELRDLLESRGFEVIAACAFVGEHAFSRTLAAGRPDQEDMNKARDFAKIICKRLKEQSGQESGEPESGKLEGSQPVSVRGEKPYRQYYRPKDENGNPVDIRKVAPKTANSCMRCGLCQEVCPMDSIDPHDPSRLHGICIKCGACIKKCPAGAKYYDDPAYLRHQFELEAQFCERKEPELF